MPKAEDVQYRLAYPEEGPNLSRIRSDLSICLDVMRSEASGKLTSGKQVALLKAANYWYLQWSGPCGRHLLEVYRLTALRDDRKEALALVLDLFGQFSADPPFYYKGYLLGHPGIPNEAVEPGIPGCGNPKGAYAALLAHVLSEYKRLKARFREDPTGAAPGSPDGVPEDVSGMEKAADKVQGAEYRQVMAAIHNFDEL